MQETPRQYTKRLLGYQQGKKPMIVLAATPQKIRRLLRGVPKKNIRTRPARGKWSVAEILAHLADAELVFGFRVRLILGSNRTPVQAYDQAIWAKYSRYGKHDPKRSLDAFQVQRERTVSLLRIVPKRMWKHYGMHVERGKETITRLTEMMAGHDINHVMQIEKLIPGHRF